MQRNAFAADDVLKKARGIGQYYGFTPFSELAEAHKGDRTRAPYPETLALDALDTTAQSVASFLKQCRDAGMSPAPHAPVFAWHTNIAPGRNAPRQALVQFHAIGADRPIADAVIIRAARAFIQDLYKETPVVHINTLGDKETRARFARELGNFFKRRSMSLPETCVNAAKRDVFEAADLVAQHACADELPSPTDHLSDASRKRFEELLEYLEMTDTPYMLAPRLLSRGNVWSETCFEIHAGGRAVAWGSRYSDLARSFFKQAMPASGAIARIETSKGPVTHPAKRAIRLRIVFVHIGEDAKRLSIKLTDDLRRAHVPLVQTIGIESLTEQMRRVEKENPPFLLIMGRKEALEGSAVLRNRETQEDIIIPIPYLAERLKTL